MSNNALGCSSLWVTDCELRGVWCGVSSTVHFIQFSIKPHFGSLGMTLFHDF